MGSRSSSTPLYTPPADIVSNVFVLNLKYFLIIIVGGEGVTTVLTFVTTIVTEICCDTRVTSQVTNLIVKIIDKLSAQ